MFNFGWSSSNRRANAGELHSEMNESQTNTNNSSAVETITEARQLEHSDKELTMYNKTVMMSTVALSLIAYASQRLIKRYVKARFYHPPLVRETSRLTIPQKIRQRRLPNNENERPLDCFEPSIERTLNAMSDHLNEMKISEGKACFAKKLATRLGADYAIVRNRNMNFYDKTCSNISELMYWAAASPKSTVLLLEIDKMYDKDRRDRTAKVEDLLRYYLIRRHKFVIAISTSSVKNIDWDTAGPLPELYVKFNFPDKNERIRLLRLQIESMITSDDDLILFDSNHFCMELASYTENLPLSVFYEIGRCWKTHTESLLGEGIYRDDLFEIHQETVQKFKD